MFIMKLMTIKFNFMSTHAIFGVNTINVTYDIIILNGPFFTDSVNQTGNAVYCGKTTVDLSK